MPGVIGSALGLVSQMSVYYDRERWKIGSATCISVWQHVQLPEQVHPSLRYASMLLGC